MPHRRFLDAKRQVWEVWDVRPNEASARAMVGKPVHQGESSPDHPRRNLARELANGWLCFETAGYKRRLWPIPEEWETMSDEELSDLCDGALEAPPSRRRAVDHQRAG